MNLKDILDRIETRLRETQQSATAASRAANLSEDAIRNIRRAVKEGKREGVSTNTLEQLAPVLQTTTAWLISGDGMAHEGGTVPKKGRVGAGQAVYPFDDGEDGLAPAPPGASKDTISVEVAGDSMFPVYEDGTLLYYSRLMPAAEMINKRCVVKVADGRMLVKTVKRGSDYGLFTLASFNAPDIEDVVLEWAAPIDWVKPR